VPTSAADCRPASRTTGVSLTGTLKWATSPARRGGVGAQSRSRWAADAAGGRYGHRVESQALVEDTFSVPELLEAKDFRLELLGPEHNEADYAAWMSSIEHIQATPGFDAGWPPAGGMSPAQNLADLQRHAEHSAQRLDFAYSVIETAFRHCVRRDCGVVVGPR
jgi:hypothetical protein